MLFVGAYLLEEKDNEPTVFTASVGNLPPQKAVLLTITYVTELDFDDGKLKYVLPTQPYAPNGRDPTPKFTNPISQEYVKDVPYGLKVEVKFDMTSNIKSISSPSHPINFEFGDSPKQATVTLIISESGAPLLKDFVVTTALFDPHQPCVRLEDIGGGKKAALVALYPKMDEEGDVFTEMVWLESFIVIVYIFFKNILLDLCRRSKRFNGWFAHEQREGDAADIPAVDS